MQFYENLETILKVYLITSFKYFMDYSPFLDVFTFSVLKKIHFCMVS
jgi:hypothetical protein